MSIPSPTEVAKLKNSNNQNTLKQVAEYCKLIDPIITTAFTEHAAAGKLTSSRGTISINENKLKYVDKGPLQRECLKEALSQVLEKAGWKILSAHYPEKTNVNITLEILNPLATK